MVVAVAGLLSRRRSERGRIAFHSKAWACLSPSKRKLHRGASVGATTYCV